jgi:hypothetical protein
MNEHLSSFSSTTLSTDAVTVIAQTTTTSTGATRTARTSMTTDGGTVTAHADAGRLVLDEATASPGWRLANRAVGGDAIVVTFVRDADSVEVTVALVDGRLSTSVNSHSSSGS